MYSFPQPEENRPKNEKCFKNLKEIPVKETNKTTITN